MILLRKREYGTLLLGDLAVFVASLWLTLVGRYFSIPTVNIFQLHLTPFSLLFAAWIMVFFLSGLYGRHTRLFRSRVVAVVLAAQGINIVIAALFFWLVPAFGIAPRAFLILYLLISSALIIMWRALAFPHMRSVRPLRGVLIATGSDVHHLAQEVASDVRYPFKFD
jgi:FlaA1/EpsC-like NDP-sugar epimerase